MPKKLTYEFVKSYFEKEGYQLLSKEYINSKTKLDYICDKGHKHNIRFNDFQQWQRCKVCLYINNTGKTSSTWKGGVFKSNLPLYKTYAPQLEKYQPVHLIKQDGLELLGVECVYCNKIFIPKTTNVVSRLKAIKGTMFGEANFYCSNGCKKACPTFWQQKYPKGFKQTTSREVQPALRNLVLKRDNYRCQICNSGLENELHCHHFTGIDQNPIESADLDNCITLCKEHHKQVHKLPGCGFNELKCSN